MKKPNSLRHAIGGNARQSNPSCLASTPPPRIRLSAWQRAHLIPRNSACDFPTSLSTPLTCGRRAAPKAPRVKSISSPAPPESLTAIASAYCDAPSKKEFDEAISKPPFLWRLVRQQENALAPSPNRPPNSRGYVLAQRPACGHRRCHPELLRWPAISIACASTTAPATAPGSRCRHPAPVRRPFAQFSTR